MTERYAPPAIMFVHSSDEGYGSDRVLVQLVQAAMDAGYAVSVLLPDDCPPGWLSQALFALDVETTRGPLAPARRRYLTGRALPRYLNSVRQARRFIRREWCRVDPALVHVNSSALVVMATIRRPRRAQVVWHVHEIVVSPSALSVLLRVVPLLAGTRVVAISDAVAAHLRKVHIHGDRIVRIHNGVASRRGSVNGLDEPGNDAEGVVAVFAGRLSGWKGYDVFIEGVAKASSRVDGLTAVLVGGVAPGEEWRVTDVTRRIFESGMQEKMRYLGFIEDIGDVFRPGRIVVVPSLWPEPFGLVTVEAMLAGCAVVASRHGGSTEIIEEGVTGLLVPPGDAGALADALQRLATDRQLRVNLGEQARKSASQRFNEGDFAVAVKGVWDELVNR